MSHCLNQGCVLPSSLLLTYLTEPDVFSYPYLLFNIQYLIMTFFFFYEDFFFFFEEIKGPELSL